MNLPENQDITIAGAGSKLLLKSADILNINWTLTRRCNYQCTYCKVYDNINGFFPSLEDLKAAIDKISLLSRKQISFTVTGGEPTLHPNYIEFLIYILQKVEKTTQIQTITNLSLPTKFYKNLCIALQDSKTKVSFKASYHFEFTNLNNFINNVQMLASNNFRIKVSVMAHPKFMTEVKDIYGEFKAIGQRFSSLSCDAIVIRENYGSVPDKRYREEDLQWLSLHEQNINNRYIYVDSIDADKEGNFKIYRTVYTPSELVASGRNQFRGMYCNAGVNMLAIDANGDIAPAVCFQKLKHNRTNIYKDIDALSSYSAPLICPFERCGCLADIQLPKFIEGYKFDSELLEAESSISSIQTN